MEKNMSYSPEYAYGKIGINNIVPPNAYLGFEIELFDKKQESKLSIIQEETESSDNN